MALVLSRRVGETVWLGDDCAVTVVAVHGQQVRLAFVAPAEVRVLRDELKEKKEEGEHDQDLG